MDGSYQDKYAFRAEWYDERASLYRRFTLFYYPSDDTLELYDMKFKKRFMRRSKIDGISLENFHVGVTINILGRSIKIVDYACENTRRKLQKQKEVVFVLMKPVADNILGKIISCFYDHGMRITRMKKARITRDDLLVLYKRKEEEPSYRFVLEYLNNKDVYGIEVIGSDVYSMMPKIIGNAEPANAAPGTIRALYGSDNVRNCLDYSYDLEESLECLQYFFPPPPFNSERLPLTATLSNCTLCIVKPHAIREGKFGGILEVIDDAGFNITALNMLVVDKINAAEFYEVYKGIVPEFKGMVDELCSGPCVSMEIVSKDSSKNTAVEFRKLVGPSDPDIARLLRPHTIRAKFGITKVQNAVHCSDLSEDGLLEVEYFFKILCL